MTAAKTPVHFLPFLLSGADDSPSKKIQVLRTGSFDHPAYGKFKITPQDLQAFKENFERNVRRVKIPFNYDHGDSVAHGTKAAGWIKSLSLNDDGTELYAEPEWTPEALKAIKDGEWQYSSAEILWNWKDPESGQVHKNVLKGVALTNQPFVKGMKAIAAHETHEQEAEPMKLSDIEATLLSEHGINLADLRTKAALVAGLEATKVELSDKVSKLTTDVTKLAADNAAMSQKVELSEKAAAKVGFDALVKKGMEDGKLTKAFAEGKLTALFASQGLKFCEELVADMPLALSTTTKGHGGDRDAPNGNAAEEVNKRAEALMASDKCSLSEAVTKVMKADPKLAQDYRDCTGMKAKG